MRKARHKWTKEEEQYLIDNYETTEYKEMSKHLGLSASQIYNQVKKLMKKNLVQRKREQYRPKYTQLDSDAGAGLNLREVKLDHGAKYQVESNIMGYGGREYFVGKVVDETKRFYVLENKHYCQCFLKSDLALGDAVAKEVRK